MNELLTKGEKVAVTYLAICVIAGSIFTFCSFWIYHYIDLEDDDERFNELEPTSIMSTDRPSMRNELT